MFSEECIDRSSETAKIFIMLLGQSLRMLQQRIIVSESKSTINTPFLDLCNFLWCPLYAKTSVSISGHYRHRSKDTKVV